MFDVMSSLGTHQNTFEEDSMFRITPRALPLAVILIGAAASALRAQHPANAKIRSGSAFAAQGAATKSDSTPPRRVVMSGPVEVPLLSDRSGRPMVDVTVNGHGPYRFLLETGARSIDLPQALIDSLKLPHTGKGPDEPQYHVDSINIGVASFKDITISTMPAGVAAMGVAGVLGLPFYQNVLLTLDYPAARVRFSRDTLPTPDSRDVLALVRVGDCWGLPITIGGTQQTAVLDTQNSNSLIVPPSVADQLAFIGGVRTVGRARTAVGPIDIKEGQLNGDVAIGRYTFPSPVLSVLEMPPDFPRRPNVGAGILRNFVVSIDQRHARLRLARGGSPVVPLPTPAGRGAAPEASNGNADLAAYTGTYGDRTVTASDGKLILTRPGGTPNELTMTARDSFTIRDIPQAKIAFVRDSTGAISTIRVLTLQGVWETAKRSGP